MTKDAAHIHPGRRRWTADQRLEIVKESLGPGASVPEVARRHGVNPNLIYAWRRRPEMGASPLSDEGRSRFALVAVTAVNDRGRAGGSGAYASAMIEVVLRNGRVLRLSECAAPSRVAPLADALEECRS
jgi:transposase-like protein